MRTTEAHMKRVTNRKEANAEVQASKLNYAQIQSSWKDQGADMTVGR